MTEAITLEDLTKRYGGATVVDAVNLSIPDGAFVSFLGASGSGKTTTLRLIAGLEQADGGRIRFRGQDITDVPPSHRDMRMMFQDYALLPNLSVAENIAFGLKLKRTRARFSGRVEALVDEYLRMVHLDGYHTRKPHELSGGQRQRVALARALITDPAIVLFDEPLGALDANLRHAMQYELKRLHGEFGKTFVYVTHDQEEAMAMSDLIAVMKDGRILQVSSPEDLYFRPNCRYVAEFVGAGNTLLDGRIQSLNGASVRMDMGDGIALVSKSSTHGLARGQHVGIHVRSENLELVADPPSLSDTENTLPVRIDEQVFLGGRTEYHVSLTQSPGTQLTVSVQGGQSGRFADGDLAHVRVDPGDLRILTQ